MDTATYNTNAKLQNPVPGSGLVGAQPAERKVGEVESLVERANLAVANLESEVEMLASRLHNVLPSVQPASPDNPLNAAPSAQPRMTQLGGQMDNVNYRIDQMSSVLRLMREQLEN